MILPAQKFLIVIQFARDAHLVAGRAKLRGAHERFEKRLLVKLRFGFDHLLIDVLQNLLVLKAKG